MPLTEAAIWNPAGTAVLTTTGQVVEIRLDGTRIAYGQIGSRQILSWLPSGEILLLGRQ